MKKEFLAIMLFVKFGYNYPDVKCMINYICKKTGKMYLEKHLLAKFNQDYEIFGSHAVMNYFFCDIDRDLQEALVDYAINVYAPHGMATTYEEYKSL